MNILLIGSLSVNPERFLPLLQAHKVYGIWECRPKWKRSLRAAAPYCEIPVVSIEEVKNLDIDIIWCLLSPWDGLDTSLELLERYPEIPLVRQSQGGATPWWHQEDKGNYDFQKFSEVLERASGLMFNAEKYRDCLIEQGVKIDGKSYLITNGMAFNYDLLPESLPCHIPFGIEPHIALIGRQRHSPGIFVKNSFHVHYHSASPLREELPFRHKEKYLGDVSMIRKKSASIQKIFEFKKESWYSTFSKYDAGLMHFYSSKGIDVFEGVDINVPGRINTYLLSGLPPIISNRDSAILDFLKGTDCFIAFESESDLVSQLRDREHLKQLRENVLKVQYKFSAQYELPRIIKFFDGMKEE